MNKYIIINNTLVLMDNGNNTTKIIEKYVVLIINENIISALNFGKTPGNSARLIRNVIAPIMALLIYIGIKYIDKSKIKFFEENRALMKKIFIAIFFILPPL